jgi:hypothetical protein
MGQERERKTVNGRNPVFEGKTLDELSSYERMVKYGTSLSPSAERGIRAMENAGAAMKHGTKGEQICALGQILGTDKQTRVSSDIRYQQAQPNYPQNSPQPQDNVQQEAKRIALKLMNNEELTEEEEVFLVEHEDAIEKELE